MDIDDLGVERSASGGDAGTNHEGSCLEDQKGCNMADRGSPEMSVIIVTDRYDTIRKTVRHLREQELSDRLEILIVTQAGADLDLDAAEIGAFCRVRVVEVPAIRPLALATAAGIRQASAPVVALVEDHAYPGPAGPRRLSGHTRGLGPQWGP